MKLKSLSWVRLLATPWTVAHQAPPSMGFSRQETSSAIYLISSSVAAVLSWVLYVLQVNPGVKAMQAASLTRIHSSSDFLAARNSVLLTMRRWLWHIRICKPPRHTPMRLKKHTFNSPPCGFQVVFRLLLWQGSQSEFSCERIKS